MVHFHNYTVLLGVAFNCKVNKVQRGTVAVLVISLSWSMLVGHWDSVKNGFGIVFSCNIYGSFVLE